MRRLLNTAIGRKKTTKPDERPVAVLPPPYVMAGPPHAQDQAALFGRLSAELRILIYEATLSDSDRLLHIAFYRGTLHRPGVGHWHCEDTDSPFPTWQHKCYGFRIENGYTRWRREPRSNSNLVPLLLACRLIYSEAIHVLYNTNIFSFKGASGLLKFHSLLPAPNWDRIRRLNISTVFLVPKSISVELSPNPYMIPPEGYDAWEKACSTIGTLHNLQYITVDLTVWNYYDHKGANTIAPEDFKAILGPLRAMNANEFEVEMNAEPPEAVRMSLEPLNFSIAQRHRPYNEKLFRRK